MDAVGVTAVRQRAFLSKCYSAKEIRFSSLLVKTAALSQSSINSF